jgi:hypothetical protein
MSLTVANAKTVLSTRVGGLMTAAGLDGSATSTAYDDPLAYAFRSLGFTPASLIAVVDADLLVIDTTNVDQLWDVAEWRSLASAVRNYTEYGARIDLDEKRPDEVRKGLQDAESKALKSIQLSYGVGLAVAQAGSLEMDFMETDPTQTDPVNSFNSFP